MRELRIVYMGTPDFAVYPLQKLLEAGHQVVAVVTNPDKPAGRGQKIQESPVKKFAVEKGIPVLQPERFRDERFLEELRAFQGFAARGGIQDVAGGGLEYAPVGNGKFTCVTVAGLPGCGPDQLGGDERGDLQWGDDFSFETRD